MADPHLTTATAPAVALDIPCAAWSAAVPEIERLSRAAAELALRRTCATSDAELSIVLTDDSEIQALNRAWRGQDKPTNVLSFPASDGPRTPGAPVLLGDVVVAFETARREVAEGAAASLADHLSHLIVHGVLHLLGHDHETDAEAEVMERLESELLSELGVPDPYDERRTP